MANKYLQGLEELNKSLMPRNTPGSVRLGAQILNNKEPTTPGASGSWGNPKKKPIPTVASFFENDATEMVEEGQAKDAEMARVTAAAMAKPGETSKIDDVTDRYQSYYDDSRSALDSFNKEAFGESGNTGFGDSASTAAYNSPERGHLMMQQSQLRIVHLSSSRVNQLDS